MEQYICYLWRYDHNNTAFLSRFNEGEDLKAFKTRMQTNFPIEKGYHHTFSIFKEI